MKQEIWHGDCLELMKNIPDKSVDMVLCDLPYGTTVCKWDVVIPFGSLWNEYNRIAKEKAAIVLFCSQPFTSSLVMSNIKMWKHSWVWDKGVGVNFMHVKRQPLKTTEDIVVFSKGTPQYYPQMTPKDKPTKKSNNMMGQSSGYSVDGADNKYVGKIYTESYPEMILRFSSRSAGSRGLHPTQKPIPLLEYLIKTYTNGNELVLDNCAGSGSTLVAAKNLNRQFIGIEKEKEYYDICLKRLGINQ